MNGGTTLCRSQIKQSLQSLPWLRDDFFHQRKKDIDQSIQSEVGRAAIFKSAPSDFMMFFLSSASSPVSSMARN